MSTRKHGLSRRRFIQASLATPLVAGCSSSGSGGGIIDRQPSGITRFAHGIASGDPLQDRVMLWTRVTPDSGAGSVSVKWELSRASDFTGVVRGGTVSTDASRDFTVKVDVTGLAAGTTYYYRFSALDATSATGRTRTLAAGSVSHARFAAVSCASLPHGFFNAYRRIAERDDLAFVLHLGDYIYEYPGVDPSAPDPEDYCDQAAIDAGRQYSEDNRHEIVTLEDYRARHANYKLDQDLQALHLQHPIITIWDDHEFADNTYRDGAFNHQPDEDGDWETRNANARQAYFEWLPIRPATPGDTTRIDRRFQIGDLVDLLTLDTRWIGRSAIAQGTETPAGIEVFTDSGTVADPTRTLINAPQEAEVVDLVTNSAAQWKLIGQQVVFGQWKLVGAANASNTDTPGGQGGQFINTDQWDGYPRNRERIWQAIRDANADNVVILTGDVHSSWAQDITEDPNNAVTYNPVTGTGSMAVEFVCPAVTSPSAFPDTAVTVDAFLTQNPHILYGDINARGYMIIDITTERCQGEWWFVDDHLMPSDGESFATAYAAAAGTNHLVAVDTPSAGR